MGIGFRDLADFQRLALRAAMNNFRLRLFVDRFGAKVVENLERAHHLGVRHLQLNAPHRHADVQVHRILIANRCRDPCRGELPLREFSFPQVKERRDGDQIFRHDR